MKGLPTGSDVKTSISPSSILVFCSALRLQTGKRTKHNHISNAFLYTRKPSTFDLDSTAFTVLSSVSVLVNKKTNIHTTVVPTKSYSGVILCLQLLSKTLTCTLHLSYSESIDHLCINPIQRIGLIRK